jgi:hypothetical protein
MTSQTVEIVVTFAKAVVAWVSAHVNSAVRSAVVVATAVYVGVTVIKHLI